MNDLINYLNLDSTLKSKVLKYYDKKQNKIKSLVKRCKDGNFTSLSCVDDVTRLAVCLECSECTKEFYINKGIPVDIFYSTMQDISIWCENNKNNGLKNYRWIQNHLKGELFKIGRLQYQMFTIQSNFLNYDLLPFNKGDKMIYIHIPQGEKLIYSECVESLHRAKAFFEKYFSDFDFTFFFCESWLLYEENYAFMNTSSNILQFQSLFDIICSKPLDAQAIERIFGKRKLRISAYPEKTSLQKSAKAYMQNGNKLGIGVGIINKYEI